MLSSAIVLDPVLLDLQETVEVLAGLNLAHYLHVAEHRHLIGKREEIDTEDTPHPLRTGDVTLVDHIVIAPIPVHAHPFVAVAVV